MNTGLKYFAIVVFLLALTGCESQAEKDAVAAIRGIGGTVDRGLLGGPVISVTLTHLEVTDDWLEHLEGLPNLRSLGIAYTQVADAGLVHLKGLTELEHLDLRATQVTDAGLEHLKGLTKLKNLYLHDTKVSSEGWKNLKSTLPQCSIDPLMFD
jgi:Leucine-rich repeat (LRR) protein